MELRKKIESLLFSSGKAMKEQELVDLTGHTLQEVQEALAALKKDYDDRDTSLFLMSTGDSWKLNVREKYLGLVTKIVTDTELPFPVLETLGVIAFKAPAWQAEIIKARGTNAYEHVGVLVEQGFVEKKKEGRSFRLTLTPKFFQYFEVAGHDEIKEAMKDVKVPEPPKPVAPTEPGKVGDLEVVDVAPDPNAGGEQGEKKTLGNLEIVEDMPEVAPVDVIKPDTAFLDDIDKKIDDLSKRNDEFDEDASLNKQIDWKKELGLDEELVKDMEGETVEEPGKIRREKEDEAAEPDEIRDGKTEEAEPAEEETEGEEEKKDKSPAKVDEAEDEDSDFEEGEEEEGKEDSN